MYMYIHAMIDVTLQLWTRRERSSSYDSFSSASSNTDGMPFSVLAHDSGISTPLHNPFDEYRYMHTYLNVLNLDFIPTADLSL